MRHRVCRQALWVVGQGPLNIFSSIKAMRTLEKFVKVSLFRMLYIKVF